MKKKLFGIVILVLFSLISCREKDRENSASETQNTNQDHTNFNKRVGLIRSFYQAHCDEDLEAQSAMISDSLKWSPPDYNGNKWLGKKELLAALKGYHDAFENIKYVEGSISPDTLVSGFWCGSDFPKDYTLKNPHMIRVYGTWTATHTESGKEIGVKFFSLTAVKDGKLIQASDYFDANGLAVQIAAE